MAQEKSFLLYHNRMRGNKYMKIGDMVNQRFGLLTVLSITKDHRCLCQCDCGNKKIILPANIKAGRTKSCGCLEQKNRENRKKNLVGQRFGRLLVIEETSNRIDRNIVWKCQCDCGNLHYTTTRNLVRNETKSCGCILTERSNIAGKRFGKLIAQERIQDKTNGKILWLCQCDCGNTTIVQINNLKSGHTKSCGCMKDMHQLGCVEGTNLSLIRSKKLNRNNKSGVKGVSYNTTRKRWIARLTFQGKVYSRSCKSFDEAIVQRKQMERRIEQFLLKYQSI